MEYISTRGATAVSAGAAILKGISKDGGLYVPSSFPTIDKEDIDALLDMEYYQRAAYIISKFLTDYDYDDLLESCRLAYAKFDDPAPLIKVDSDTYMLELWHGPTNAFKDIALTLLPYLITQARKSQGSQKKTLILVATSGDTGKAAMEGFADVKDTEIMVFYPIDGVSDMQKLQMQTSKGGNVHAIGIQGNFDDAQWAVKSVLNDERMIDKLDNLGYAMSSANSINWGRLVPQIVYYISAYIDLLGADEISLPDSINFVVPTGNFGNVLAAYYAKKMGVPIAKLIVASNKNKVLTDFFSSGRYDINRAFHKTMSPSMDILISSNLERLLFEMGDRQPDFVKKIMEELDVYGTYSLDTAFIKDKIPEFEGYYSDEDSTLYAMDNFYDMFDYLLDPHTAVGVSAYHNYLADTGDETKTVIVSTASPFKFPTDVYYAVSGNTENDAFKAVKKLVNYTGVEVPDNIAGLKKLPILHDLVIPKDAIKDTIVNILEQKE